jgi:hypothetical protein
MGRAPHVIAFSTEMLPGLEARAAMGTGRGGHGLEGLPVQLGITRPGAKGLCSKQWALGIPT